MDNSNNKKNYLSAALIVFLTLNLDIVVHLTTTQFIGDDVIYRASISKFVTIILWVISLKIAIKYLRINIRDLLFDNQYSPRITFSFFIVLILLSLINYKVKELGVFQIIHEYRYSMANYNQLGAVTFILQIIYYFLEASFVTLIIIMGSKWGENKKYNHILPYGGIILAITWGAVHFLTKNVLVGIYGVLISILIGLGYIHTKKNAVLTYIIALAIFLI